MRLKGKVSWFNPNKGYGFILPDGVDSIQDAIETHVFVHYSAIETAGYKNLDKNELVEYEVSEGPKGPQAVKVWKRK